MPKAMFFRPVKKGKVAPNVQNAEPDGDEAAQEFEDGNENAPGPLTKKVGGQEILKSIAAKKTLQEATGKDDPAEPDADDALSLGEGNHPPGGSQKPGVKATSDKPQVKKPKVKAGHDATEDPMPAKGKARFGKPGSPIQF